MGNAMLWSLSWARAAMDGRIKRVVSALITYAKNRLF
jgi:hypothetical protein